MIALQYVRLLVQTITNDQADAERQRLKGRCLANPVLFLAFEMKRMREPALTTPAAGQREKHE